MLRGVTTVKRGKRSAFAASVRIPNSNEAPASERIYYDETVEPREVAISRYDFANSVLYAERSDVRVVNEIAGRSSRRDDSFHDFCMTPRFGEKQERGTLQEARDRPQSVIEGERWVKDARMRRDPQELVDAGPRNRPGQIPLGQKNEEIVRDLVLRNRLDVRCDEHVRVDRLHVTALP